MSVTENKENFPQNAVLKDSFHYNAQPDAYTNKIQELEYAISKLQVEIKEAENEMKKKEQCIKTAVKDKQNEKECISEYKKGLRMLEFNIKHNCEKKPQQKKILEKQVAEKAARVQVKKDELSEIIRLYDESKSQLEECQSNEDALVKKLENREVRLASLRSEYAALEQLFKDQEGNKTDEQAIEENEQLLKEIAKTEAVIRRLNIKTSSLEGELKRKEEECNALSALCEDITGHN